jgi:hypothetical protein
MANPQHPLVRCRKATDANHPHCDFEWRIERLDGVVTGRGVSRMPRDNERLVERCTRCHKQPDGSSSPSTASV